VSSQPSSLLPAERLRARNIRWKRLPRRRRRPLRKRTRREWPHRTHSNRAAWSTRLTAADPTRLGVDAHGVAEWRSKGFHPVLPEANPDLKASVLYRILALKRNYPLSSARDITKDFTFELDRKQVCATEAKFDDYVKQHPLWGMPYGLPGLSTDEAESLGRWLALGAPHDEPPPLATALQSSIVEWETFLNDPSPKSRLAARYIYEQKTPIGPVVEIPTRRPFDDPKAEHVF
jgi:hypothetical protein